MPEWFDFGDQGDAMTYKQLGNGVSVGAAYHVFREHVLRDAADIPAHIVDPVLQAAPEPVVLQSGNAGPVGDLGGQADPATVEVGVLRDEQVRLK
jgi:hypothetical protein